MGRSDELSIMVVSCDKYSDLWDDMFNLLDRFWPDRPYETYLATDTLQYNREGVTVINFGNIREWMVCTRKAVEQIKSPYILFLMEDYFVTKDVKTDNIKEDVELMKERNIDYMNIFRKPYYLEEKDFDYLTRWVVKIPKNTRYGLDTAAAIWKRDFFIEQLCREDGNAWRFESMLVEDALSERGLPGNLYFDVRYPMNICSKEVVLQGKFYPDAVKEVEATGYKILSPRERMNSIEIYMAKLRKQLSSIKYGRRLIKKVGRLCGMKFFTND